MNTKAAIDFALSQLESNLLEKFHYHSLEHTKSVILKAEEIAKAEGLSDGNIELVKLAAAYHDIGLLLSYSNHEQASCEFISKSLPNFDFEAATIREIEELVMSTKLPQEPKSLNGQVLCDADLAYLGENQYETIAELLYKEMCEFNMIESREEWKKKQINFLENHHYWTCYAKQTFANRKDLNLIKLRQS